MVTLHGISAVDETLGKITLLLFYCMIDNPYGNMAR